MPDESTLASALAAKETEDAINTGKGQQKSYNAGGKGEIAGVTRKFRGKME